MNFVTSLSSNKHRKVVYNLIFVIVDRCTKMTRYIFVIIRIDVVELAKVFFDKIVLRFETLVDIVSDKGFVFTSVFSFVVCFYARIRRQLSIAFYP
jgi:hypothetical protein